MSEKEPYALRNAEHNFQMAASITIVATTFMAYQVLRSLVIVPLLSLDPQCGFFQELRHMVFVIPMFIAAAFVVWTAARPVREQMIAGGNSDIQVREGVKQLFWAACRSRLGVGGSILLVSATELFCAMGKK